MPLRISTAVDRGRVWMRLTGDLDLESVGAVRDSLREVEREQPHTIVFDLRDLRFIDSSGISELLIAHRRGERVGRRVLLSTTPESPTARVVELTGLDAFMEHADGPPLERRD